MFESHMESIHLKKKFPCKTCGKLFGTTKYLQKHIKDCHLVGYQQKCGICHKVFRTRKALAAHKIRVHSGGFFFCDLCKFQGSAKSEIMMHVKTHARFYFPCTECDKSYKNQWQLNKHIRGYHGRTTTCQLCALTFAHSASLFLHRLLNHSVKVPQSAIEDVKKLAQSFETPQSGIEDLKKLAQPFETPQSGIEDLPFAIVLKCERCHQSFADDDILRIHREAWIQAGYDCAKEKNKMWEEVGEWEEVEVEEVGEWEEVEVEEVGEWEEVEVEDWQEEWLEEEDEVTT